MKYPQFRFQTSHLKVRRCVVCVVTLVILPSLYVAVCAVVASAKDLPSATAQEAGGGGVVVGVGVGEGDGEICISFLMMTSCCRLSMAAAAAAGLDEAS